eukprot:GCRY01003665.1.p1 GENE.GCRY01003665.1~~GCRY01003665.1.p1  ORF type:complete len:279 (+),score=58.92 GCRY01003665.1:239-1075(+)
MDSDSDFELEGASAFDDSFFYQEDPIAFAPYTRSNPQVYPEISKLNLRLVARHSLWGHLLWNAAVFLADYFDTSEGTACVANKRVLELGAAAALPAIVCGLVGANTVVATDYPDKDLVDNIRINFEENLPSALLPRCHARGHLWGSDCNELCAMLPVDTPSGACPCPDCCQKYDVVLMTDLIASSLTQKAYPALLQSARDCVAKHGQVLVSFTHHHPEREKQDLSFFELAASDYNFKVEKVASRVFDRPMFEPKDSANVGERLILRTVHFYRLRPCAD